MGDPVILANRISDWAAKKPDLDILTFVSIDADGSFVEEHRSYQQLWNNGQRLAAWLRERGMRKGDAFGILMENHPEFVDLMVASSILGSIFVPIDPRSKGDKLKYMLDFAGCKGVVAADYALARVAEVWAGRDENWILSLTAGPDSPGSERLKARSSFAGLSPHLPWESPILRVSISGATS